MAAVLCLENAEKVFTLLDLQGEICTDAAALDGLKLGLLRETRDKVRDMQVQLTIGRHLLTGKLMQLGKPLAVVEKTEGRLLIKGFAKEKWVFASRPAPLPDMTVKKPKIDSHLRFHPKCSNGK